MHTNTQTQMGNTKMKTLDEGQRWTLINALTVAAEQYGKDAEAVQNDRFHAAPGMAETFVNAQYDAKALAELIEQAEEIELT